ncbi:CRISPR-associated endonuclease Cas3'' [Actinoplanes sp. NPDC051851]|uniref:CRISPR-associated endonuclease Cas3'' n=1 Tax=Actinoplanes sp. NPDC051851 TaxID=3154753 RepID=UPI00343D252A
MSINCPLWAHTPPPGGGAWHALDAHLRGTAELGRRFAEPFGGGEITYWLGRLHDLGKASHAWQRRLALVVGTGERVGIDHKVVGARLAFERGLRGFAVAILGHHGGLVDVPSLGKEFAKGVAADNADALRSLATLVPDLPDDLSGAVPPSWLQDPLAGELGARLCFSALVDADFLDTEAHFRQLTTPRVAVEPDFKLLAERFEAARVRRLSGRRGSPVDVLREQVYADCVAGAASPPGIFRLPAPTGAGKTLAAAGFGLRHAALHGHRRVIVAVPFLTITEQNAAVYRDLLGDDGQVVLEHHSGVDWDAAGRGPWDRLAAENWDAPFVVTTFVRLFESLYGRKPSAMRRVHRLAGAVIILDEIQALPHAMLAPILSGLKLLVKHFGTTVVLSSATQPDFWALREFDELDPVDLVESPKRLASQLRRVRFEWQVDPEPSLADIADQAAALDAALVVVNTTADAVAVHGCWRDMPSGHAWHLSTRMCPRHRRRVLEAVRARLAAGQRTLLVSTQLIEAGVDLDYPAVFRAMAPVDSLLQAAGRANRDGRMSEPGRVVIFSPAGGGMPPGYRIAVDQTRLHFGPDRRQPDDLDAHPLYYQGLYDALALQDPMHVGQRIQDARRRWEFQTVASGPMDPRTKARDLRLAFRMITESGVAVVTPQAADDNEQREVRALIDALRGDMPSAADFRRLQPFITTLHPSLLRRPEVLAQLDPIKGESVLGGLAEWRGGYDEATGIDLDPAVEEFLL